VGREAKCLNRYVTPRRYLLCVLDSELTSFLGMEPREQISSAMPSFCMGRPGASDAPGVMSTQALLAGRVVVAICVVPDEHIGF
jgi:hypothetical protein